MGKVRSSKIKLQNKSGKKRNNNPVKVFQKNNPANNNKPEEIVDEKNKDNEFEEDEIEDCKDLVQFATSAQFSSLLNGSEEKLSRKRRKNKDCEIQEFEKVPRRSDFVDTNEEKGERVNLLPIKEGGMLVRRHTIAQTQNTEVEEKAEPVEEEVADDSQLSAIELMAKQQAEINAKKLTIAQLSQDIIEYPERNMKCLKSLLALYRKDQALSVRKLVLLSLLEVFKDIIPSYRIRELTDQERGTNVGKDVQKVRDFEESLLSSYKEYLQHLEDTFRECMKILQRKRQPNTNTNNNINNKHSVSMAVLCMRCFGNLLTAAPHFNFRTNIIAVVVPTLELRGPLSEVSQICFDTIKHVFRNDSLGDVSLEIVKLISKLTKAKPNVQPKVLETFLSLRINDDALKMAAMKGNKIERLKQKQEALRKLSRKEKKRKKVEDKLEKELQEAEAVESSDKLQRCQTDLVKHVFVTYFRQLKHSETRSLGVVLKGLAKYAHVMSIEFFDDLMTCMSNLLQKQSLRVEDKLNCIATAFKILSGKGEVLVIDPQLFYKELYTILLHVSTNTEAEQMQLTKDCIDTMIFKRRKQISIAQVFGLFKRLSTITLQQSTEQLFEYLLLVRNMLQMHEKCDLLLDSEVFGSGAFDAGAVDPALSHATNTCLWELTLLRHHFHPHTPVYCAHIANGAPSQGKHALAKTFIQSTQNVGAFTEKPLTKKATPKTDIDFKSHEYAEIRADKLLSQFVDSYF